MVLSNQRVNLFPFWCKFLFLFLGATSAPSAMAAPLDQAYFSSKNVQINSISQSTWHELLDSIRSMGEKQQVEQVNFYFNSVIQYVTDEQNWGVPDYWSTPAELLEKGAGDCEDLAIAKYFSLIFAGVPANKLLLSYAYLAMPTNNSVKQTPHMVLAYFPTGSAEPLILDNFNPDIRQLSKRKDLDSVLYFNTTVLISAKTKNTYPIAKYLPWSDFLSRSDTKSFLKANGQ